MGFSSSILSSKPSTNEVFKINEFVNTPNDFYLYDLLEFNDDVHDIDISSKIAYYRNLNEAVIAESNGMALTVYNEGILSDAVKRLVAIITKIIDFIKSVARKIFGLSSANKSKYDSCNKRYRNSNSENSWTFHRSDKRILNVYHYPNIDKIDTQQFRACINNINSELERVCSNQTTKTEASEKSKVMAFKTLGKLVSKYIEHKPDSTFNASSIVDEKSFMEYVRSELCYITEHEMDYDKFAKYFYSLRGKIHSGDAYSKRVSEFEHDLKRAKQIVANAVFNNKEQEKHANDLVLQINAVVQAYANMIMTIHKFEAAEVHYYCGIVDKYVACVSTNESGFIHGEKFDSDTLFDNEDYRDFNRTEWIDLNITTECYEIKFEMVECAKRIAIQEALIFADDQYNKFGRLMAMREAEEVKTKTNIKGIIESIKKFLETFIRNIKNRYSKNAKILRRNMKLVEKPIIIKEIRSAGDIIAGMYRIQQKLNIIPFNYDTMKDDLKDKETFFKNKILPSMKNTSQYTKRDAKFDNGMSIADFCKAYYGASMPEDKYPKCEFSTADIEANKNNIVRFLQTETIFTAKSDLQTLENESKKVYSKMQQSNPNDQKPVDNASNDQKPAGNDAKNESYYSELYGTWFTEAEIEMGNNPEGNGESSNNSAANTEEATAFRVYMETYKDVILAKMTASEFIVSELMQIMLAHIYSYMSPDQKKAEQNTQAKENPNVGIEPPKK